MGEGNMPKHRTRTQSTLSSILLTLKPPAEYAAGVKRCIGSALTTMVQHTIAINSAAMITRIFVCFDTKKK
jgi:hypothetical protein